MLHLSSYTNFHINYHSIYQEIQNIVVLKSINSKKTCCKWLTCLDVVCVVVLLCCWFCRSFYHFWCRCHSTFTFIVNCFSIKILIVLLFVGVVCIAVQIYYCLLVTSMYLSIHTQIGPALAFLAQVSRQNVRYFCHCWLYVSRSNRFDIEWP